MTYLQQSRLLSIDPPTGKNQVLLTQFEGHEALSELFYYQLTLYSKLNQQEINAWLGKLVTFSVNTTTPGGARYFHGLIQSITIGKKNRLGFTTLKMTVVPSLWLLTQSSDCRIFQNLSVIDTVKIILSDHNILEIDFSRLQKRYPLRDYCVQYNETAYRFITRIFAEENITFYFSHSKTQHLLVLCDTYASHPTQQNSSPMHLRPGLLFTKEKQIIFSIKHYAQDNSFITQPTQTIIQTYTTDFKYLPGSTHYSPPKISKPIIAGPQTAIVVGSDSQELYTNRQGQVKVQFHWIRSDENSTSRSCWITTDQRFVVRVGQEVLVNFIQGDPDRPIILGALYNSIHRPCFNTTTEKFKSGFKSRVFYTKNIECVNELSFDHSDHPYIQFRAQQDFIQTVSGNRNISSGSDTELQVEGDYQLHVQSGRYYLTSNNKITLQSPGGSLSLSPDEVCIYGYHF